MPRAIYDISQPIRVGGLIYPGNPEIRFHAQQAIAQGAGANVTEITIGSHTGTHVDAPKHFIDDGATVDELPLERLVGPALVVEFPDDVRAIEAWHLQALELGDATRILFKTRNSRLLEEREFATDYTYLAPDGAELLAERGVVLVGTDYFSIEQFRSGHHRTHRTLLGKGIVIVEGLALADVPPGQYDLVCLPLRLEGLDGAPARTILIG